MFLRYFLTQTLNRPLYDVPLHVSADVCLPPTSASRCEVHDVGSRRNVVFELDRVWAERRPCCGSAMRLIVVCRGFQAVFFRGK